MSLSLLVRSQSDKNEELVESFPTVNKLTGTGVVFGILTALEIG